MTYIAADIDAVALANLAKAMSCALRIRIMGELTSRPMSPTMFYNECNVEGHSVSAIAKHFRKLEKYGLAEAVEQKSGKHRRGGVETFYRATKHAVFDEIVWPVIPVAFRGRITAETFLGLTKRVKKAFEAETIDARDDRHFTWTGFLLDLQAWKELIQLVDNLFYDAFRIAERAAIRMRESGGRPIHMTLGLIAFESPEEEQRLDTP